MKLEQPNQLSKKMQTVGFYIFVQNFKQMFLKKFKKNPEGFSTGRD